MYIELMKQIRDLPGVEDVKPHSGVGMWIDFETDPAAMMTRAEWVTAVLDLLRGWEVFANGIWGRHGIQLMAYAPEEDNDA